jgi:hypothetical protein
MKKVLLYSLMAKETAGRLLCKSQRRVKRSLTPADALSGNS